MVTVRADFSADELRRLATASKHANTAPPAVQSKAANAKHGATMTRDRNHSRCGWDHAAR
jgi:hypothetical protein